VVVMAACTSPPPPGLERQTAGCRSRSVSSECSTESTASSTRNCSSCQSDPELQLLIDRPEFGGITTLMVRNVPGRCSQQSLLDFFVGLGFHGVVDLFYMPVDFRKRVGLGYCFVNLTSAESAALFRSKVQGVSCPFGRGNGKVLQVSPARIQGFNSNLTALRNNLAASSGGDTETPTIINPMTGIRLRFPAPTGRLRRTRKKVVMDFAGLMTRLCRQFEKQMPYSDASSRAAKVVSAFETSKKAWKLLDAAVRAAEDSQDGAALLHRMVGSAV